MSKPILAIDVDEVLFPFIRQVLEDHHSRTGYRPTLSEVKTTRLSPVLGIPEHEVLVNIEAMISREHLHIDPLPDALASLKFLHKLYEPVVLTARWDRLIEGSTAWLKHHFPDIFQDMYFIGTSRSKAEACLEIGAVALVDDSLNMVAGCAQAGLGAILFGDYPRNQATELPAGVARAKDWSEVVGLLT
jgi:5'(3')-deoxyribonucleotidase